MTIIILKLVSTFHCNNAKSFIKLFRCCFVLGACVQSKEHVLTSICCTGDNSVQCDGRQWQPTHLCHTLWRVCSKCSWKCYRGLRDHHCHGNRSGPGHPSVHHVQCSLQHYHRNECALRDQRPNREYMCVYLLLQSACGHPTECGGIYIHRKYCETAHLCLLAGIYDSHWCI